MQDDFLGEESLDLLSHEQYDLIRIITLLIHLSIFCGLICIELSFFISTLSIEVDKVGKNGIDPSEIFISSLLFQQGQLFPESLAEGPFTHSIRQELISDKVSWQDCQDLSLE